MGRGKDARPDDQGTRPVGTFRHAPRGTLWIAAVAAAAAVAFLYLVRAVLLPFFFAAALAYLIDPLVEALHRRGLGRGWAILVAYAFIGLVAAGLALFVLPDLVAELNRLTGLVPLYASKVEDLLLGLQSRYRRLALPAPLRLAVDAGIGRLRDGLQVSLRATVAGILGLVGSLFSLALAPVLGYYILEDLPRFRSAFLAAVPPRARRAAAAYLRDLDLAVSGFVRGQLLIAASVGLLVTVAMWVLRVRFALTLGVVAGLGELVPYFGPILGATPALALAALDGPRLLLKVAIAFALIQQLEGAVLGPKIVGGATGLHPLVVVFALLAAGHFLGAGGLVIAVPATAVLKVSLQHAVRWAVARRRAA